MSPAGPLAGCGIVVTRPAAQAMALAAAIHAAGGQVILFPVIEILDPIDIQPLLAVIDQLETCDLAIFISPNAVVQAMRRITARRDWPPGLRAAAIGPGGVRELQYFGINEIMAPAQSWDSEGLLALPQLQAVAGQRMVIFRGNGGRELLGNTLTARGAQVESVECYRRACPRVDVAPLLQAWARNAVHAVSVTSSEGVRNLFEMLGQPGQPLLCRTPVFVPHPRIAAVARELGCAQVIECAPGNEGLIAALQQWAGTRQGVA